MPPVSSSAADSVRRVREDLARGDFHAGLSNATGLLNPVPLDGSSPLPINSTQTLRLLLLRADCYTGLRSHLRALEDAKTAIQLTNALSPQAFYIAGRECYRLGRLKEALDYFDSAETLMTSGVGVTETAPNVNGTEPSDPSSDSSGNRDDAWASVGVDPAIAPAGMPTQEHRPLLLAAASDSNSSGVASSASSAAVRPIQPSFEWSQELEVWRKYHSEVRLLHHMSQTHVVPARMAHQAIEFVSKQSTSSGSKAQVIVIRNNSEATLRFAADCCESCEIQSPYAFADVIKPGDVAIAAVGSTGWTGASKCCVLYNIEMAATVAFVCESPMMSDYAAGTLLRAGGKASFDAQRAMEVVKTKTRPTASDEVVVGQRRLKAIVSHVSNVTTFSLTQVRPVTLTVAELVPALEFLPPAALRKMSAVSWHLRDCVNRLPPPHHYTPPHPGGASESSSWFPNYLFASDSISSPWTVHDASDVTWRIAFDSLAMDLEDYCVVDVYDNRVLTVAMDLQSKGFTANVYYGGGKRRQLVSKIQEHWNPFSKYVAWRLNNGRKLGSVNVASSEVGLCLDALSSGGSSGDAFLCMRKCRPGKDSEGVLMVTPKGSGANNSLVIVRRPGEEVVAEVKYLKRGVPLSATKRGDVVAEIVLKPGCDAFLASVLAVYGRTKWSP